MFVYDTLMNRDILAERAPDPELVTTARINSRRFIINRDGLPGITPRRGHTVYGVVYQLPDISLTCLSLQMGFPTTVERFGGFVRDPAGTLMVVEFFSPGTSGLERRCRYHRPYCCIRATVGVSGVLSGRASPVGH
jgi:hypothetical protein